MLTVKEKLDRNRRIAAWVWGGMAIVLVLLIAAWVGMMVVIYSAWYLVILIPVGITIIIAYIAGAIIRGKELHSIGIDLESMDNAEIDVLIALLNKQKSTNKEGKK